jgi:hypothetical protein
MKNAEKEKEFAECIFLGCLNISFDECDFAFVPGNCPWLREERKKKGLSSES